ncbi:type I polyketide synthase [Candidatus Mycobacterium wuenschmannii]|uniref:Type I polyketide synthase n=1 Tax=Candidatus Mycobacterium wuenschmannii TaxID=3027808 RepID=A0ABY8W2B4_9MYCO|nr:type I polyketide synthase [Candidatus Mycobacterium wuenschmannii]WIM89867.1 type I polyketide synthase [Candidatus Mycobacterium wuenschmannii]
MTAPDRRAIITEALRKIDDLTARLEIAEKADLEPIAVVGMACRLPGGVDTPADYWQLLEEGRSGIVRVPADRWDADAYFSEDHTRPGTICNREGGFLTSWQPDQFDAEFFGISPREAVAMDPQQRLLLEVAWEALENAGVTPKSVRNSQTGIYVGLTTYDYALMAADGPANEMDPYIPFGSASNFAAGRLSYFLGVHGPAVVVDTACSSSLVAIHLACQSLRRRESDQALAAGTNLILTPHNSFACSRWGMLAPDGQCKTFDAAANGYTRSEGCGVVVLKRLSDAERDGDTVLALVRGSAVNQDGPSSGQTVPSGPAQQAVMRAALASARLQPSEIDYVEAHGTGTALGDPIELDALSAVFGERDDSAPLVLGSVKTNLGHLENSAGIAGFIKTVLSMNHGQIPPHLHFTELTPNAGAGASKFTIAADGMAWPDVARPRRAGVSSFGVSGTNAHVVIEQAPALEKVAAQPEPSVSTLVISGKTSARIAPIAGMLADWMSSVGADVPLSDIAHTVNNHRGRYRSFAAVAARSHEQAIAGLRALAAGEPATGVVEPMEKPHGSGTVFLYSGQGSQWAGMGKQLLADEPAFAAAVAELEPDFVAQVGFSLRDVLLSGEPVVGIDRIQPVLVGMQLALTALWRSYGVEPDAVIGHSMGEVTAAVVSGALSPADGLKVIATRSKLMKRLSGQGAMALVELDAAEAEKLVGQYPDVTVAVYAAPQQTVIAGPPEQIDAAIAAVDAQGLLARRVEVDVASHHPTVDPILADLKVALEDLKPQKPRIPLISTVGQSADTAAPAFDAEYWVVNLRNPVRFKQAVAKAAETHTTFVEISPHPLLTHGIGETLASVSSRDQFSVTAAMKRGDDETLSVHEQLATIGVTGEPAEGRRRIEIPASPWLHASYWQEKKPSGHRRSDGHPLLGSHVDLPSGREHVWQTDIGVATLPWLAAHTVHGQAVVPAAGFAEMALAAAVQALGDGVAVSKLTIERPLILDAQTRVSTQLSLNPDVNRVEIQARSAGGSWTRYAVADVITQTGPTGAAPGEGVEIALPEDVADHAEYRVHPVLLDAALQRLAAGIESEDANYQPVSVESIQLFAPVRGRARVHTELADERGRVVLTDDAGVVLAELTGIELKPVDLASVPLSLEQKIFDAAWVQSPAPQGGSVADGTWVVLAEKDSETADLAARATDALTSSTRRAISAPLGDEAALAEAFAKTADANPVGIVVLLANSPFDIEATDAALHRAQQLVVDITAAAHAAVDGWTGTSPRLWLVTRDGLSVHDDEPGDPAIGALKGLIRNWRFPGEAARVLAGEPDLGATLLDVGNANVIDTLTAELAAATGDDVVALREDGRFVERLVRATVDGGPHEAVVRDDGSYLITGGLGGLGTVVTRWLVDRGAGRIVLSGRSEPSDEQRAYLDGLGTEVVYVAGDIATAGVAERLVAAAEETGKPLRGLVHGAGVTGDGLVSALTQEGLERVWTPKVAGALRLNAATADKDMDWWVGFSSMATMLGLPGQLAYAAGNAWLDALMTWRRATGRPATAINWGQWSAVGMSSKLTYSVLDPITPDEGVEALQALVGGPLNRVGVGRLRLDRAVAATPEFRELAYFERIASEFEAGVEVIDQRPDAEEMAAAVAEAPDWSTLSTDERLSELQSRLQAILGRELRMSPSSINLDAPFPELGLDSMMAMTVLKETKKLVGLDVSANMLFNHPTIASLATYVAGLLAPPDTPEEDTAELAADSASSVLDELFDSVESASAGSESGIF